MLEKLSTPTNFRVAGSFCIKLCTSLSKCVKQTAKGKPNVKWGLFHSTCTTAEFRAMWTNLMKAVTGRTSSPIFYQYITDVMFKNIVKESFPLTTVTESQVVSTKQQFSTMTPGSISANEPLDYQECNALRYAAGYVVRSIRQKVEKLKETHPLHKSKQAMLMCISSLTVDSAESGETYDESADWTKALNRGGLTVINSQTYHFFYAVEERVRQHFSLTAISSNNTCTTFTDKSKEELLGDILADDDVLFFFSILSVEWSSNIEMQLMKMFVELWVTIRGFSFASSWMEMYKQSKKKSVEKSKGVRKHLLGASTSNSFC